MWEKVSYTVRKNVTILYIIRILRNEEIKVARCEKEGLILESSHFRYL